MNNIPKEVKVDKSIFKYTASALQMNMQKRSRFDCILSGTTQSIA